MRKRSIITVALLLVTALILAPAAEVLAKKGGSFSSGGSRSGSSSSGSSGSSGGWSSSSKPGSPAPSQPSAPSSAPSGSSPGSSGPSSSGQGSPSPSGSGWSSTTTRQATPAPATQPAPTQSAQPSQPGWSNTGGASSAPASKSGGTSAFSQSGADAAKRQAATTSYQGYQGLYSKPGNAVGSGGVSTSKPILNQDRKFGSYQDYNNYRDNYYSGRGWSAPPYAYNSFSGFGMWDAMFMWFMLSNLTSGAGFFHNHQADPGVQAFKQEAAKLAESNADLKKQLNDMNAKLDQMKKDGLPVDATAMPKDVDPNVVMAKPNIQEKASDSGTGSALLWGGVFAALLAGLAFMFFKRKTA